MESKLLKDLSNKELCEKVLNLRKENFKIRMKQFADGGAKTHMLRKNRQEVARIKTILNSRSKDESGN